MLKTVFSFNEHDEAWLEQLLVELLYSTLALLLYGSFLSLNDLCLFKLVAALSERALFSSDPLVLFSSRLLLFNSGKFSFFISFFISSFLHRLYSSPPRHASSSPCPRRSGVLTCIFFIGRCIFVIFLLGHKLGDYLYRGGATKNLINFYFANNIETIIKNIFSLFSLAIFLLSLSLRSLSV